MTEMKICPNCNSPLADTWQCPSCDWQAARLDGYLAFAPALARNNEGFRPEYFAELAKLEPNNFWFRARNRLILSALGRYFPNAANLLEVGCGTGYVLAGIHSAFPRMRLYGSEIYGNGLGIAAARVKEAALFQMDARKIPFKEEFDVIGAFDVLEHIEEDSAVLQQMYQALKAGGGIILTVPQHPFLWSQQDAAACHVRRYQRNELISKVELAGFSVKRVTSFVFLLLPLMLLSRWKKRMPDAEYDPMAELRMSPFTNAMLGAVMRLESALIRCGLNLPAGGSLLLVASKP
jgi:SAM-dependent methyltransferase